MKRTKEAVKTVILSVFLFLALVSGAVLSSKPVYSAGQLEEQPEIIVNQGIGMGLDGSMYALNLLAAGRRTGLFLRIAPELLGSQGKKPVMAVSGAGQHWEPKAKEYDRASGLLEYELEDKDTWEEGIYHINVRFGSGQQIERDVVFREMEEIKVLAVPVTALYSGRLKPAEAADQKLAEYTMQVYPLGTEDLEWIPYFDGSLCLEDREYDLNTPGGRFRVWKLLSGLNREEYDLVLGIVPENMAVSKDSDTASVTGFTYGKGVSVISMEDPAPGVTVAHEIGHCYGLGDEYENGTFALDHNMVPYGMSGRSADSLTETVSGTSPYIKGGRGDGSQGTGTLVYEEQYPFDVLTGELVEREMTSFMGLSGYEREEYWTTTDIWKTMYFLLAQ